MPRRMWLACLNQSVDWKWTQSSVQFRSVSQSCLTLLTHGLQLARLPCPLPTSGACTNLCPLSQWCHNHLILCRPILLLSSIFPSIRVFSNESALLIRWPKYWSFRFSISPSNEYSGMISFRIDWLDILAVSPRDSKVSSPIAKFKSSNSSVLTFL